MRHDDPTPGEADPAALRNILGGPTRESPGTPNADHEAALLQMIDEFLAGTLPFDELEPRFAHYYLEEMPDAALPDEQFEFFSHVYERLCFWTALDPDSDDRRSGWIDSEEFARWLTAQRATYPATPRAPR